jgi:DnaJ-class molecular chaperone
MQRQGGVNGGSAGDLIVETRVRAHPRFRREGLDLFLQLPVSLDEAYNGAEVEVPTLTGNVRLRIPAGSQSGTQLRLHGKGVRRGDRQGDLYVELQIRLPEHRDDDLADQLRRSGSDYVIPLPDELRR